MEITGSRETGSLHGSVLTMSPVTKGARQTEHSVAGCSPPPTLSGATS